MKLFNKTYLISFLFTPFILVLITLGFILNDSVKGAEIMGIIHKIYCVIFFFLSAYITYIFIKNKDKISSLPQKNIYQVLFILYPVVAILYLKDYLLEPLFQSVNVIIDPIFLNYIITLSFGFFIYAFLVSTMTLLFTLNRK